MRHKKTRGKFGREKNARKALLKSLAANLIRDGKIRTTEAKAKTLRPFVEKFITKAKVGGLANRRLMASKIGNVSAKKLFDKIAPLYLKRSGGYVRIMKLPRRQSDGSKMSIVEFV
ncbi:MAG: 50S ribosomal protein L17 [Patescibacteria group bacterium]